MAKDGGAKSQNGEMFFWNYYWKFRMAKHLFSPFFISRNWPSTGQTRRRYSVYDMKWGILKVVSEFSCSDFCCTWPRVLKFWIFRNSENDLAQNSKTGESWIGWTKRKASRRAKDLTVKVHPVFDAFCVVETPSQLALANKQRGRKTNSLASVTAPYLPTGSMKNYQILRL